MRGPDTRNTPMSHTSPKLENIMSPGLGADILTCATVTAPRPGPASAGITLDFSLVTASMLQYLKTICAFLSTGGCHPRHCKTLGHLVNNLSVPGLFKGTLAASPPTTETPRSTLNFREQPEPWLPRFGMENRPPRVTLVSGPGSKPESGLGSKSVQSQCKQRIRVNVRISIRVMVRTGIVWSHLILV